MLNKLRNNIGAVILIAILGLILMGATYVNLGPTSNIDGDVGVSAGHDYYINDVSVTYDLENLTNWMDSSGIAAGGVVSEGTNAGTFKVTAITSALLRATASATGILTSVTLAEQDNQAIAAADTTYYVIFTYGDPCTITSDVTAPNGWNAISLGKVMKDTSDNVHYVSGGFRLGDGVAKLWKRAKALRDIELMSGNSIAYSGTNNFTMTEGKVYASGNLITQAVYDSATTTFTTAYTGYVEGNSLTGIDIAIVDGGGGNDSITRTAADFVTNGYVVGDELTISGSVADDGTYTLLSVVAGTVEVATGSFTGEAAGESITLTVAKYKIDFEHYDNAGTLTAIGNNKYGCHWVYRHVDDGDVYVRYGVGSYTLADAETAEEPTKPTHLTDFGCLIGKIIAPQAGGSFTAIWMWYDKFFGGTAVSDHANLSNLDYASSGHTGFQAALTNEAGLYGALSDVSDFIQATEANSIDSAMYVDGSIDHEHLAADIISGLANVTSEDTDYILIWDNTDSALKKVDMGEVRGGGGAGTYLELTDTPAAYDNGKYAKSTADGVVWDIPAGGGDVSKVGTPADSQIGVWTGDGTIEGAASLTYDGSNLQLTGDIGATGSRITKGWFANLETTGDLTVNGTALASIYMPIFTGTDTHVTFFDGANSPAGEAGFTYIKGTDTLNVVNIACTSVTGALTGNADTVTSFTPASGSLTLAGADALTLTTTAATNVTLPTTGTLLANTVEDTTPELGGEMDCGAHSIGFTQQTVTYASGTTTADWTNGNKAIMTFGAGNITTFAFTNPTNPCNVVLKIVQDATGSRVVTAWDADIKWAGGSAPTLSTGANAIDIISFYWDGTNYFGVASLNFS